MFGVFTVAIKFDCLFLAFFKVFINNLFYFRQLRSISLKKQNKQKQTKTRATFVQATHLFTDYTRRVQL